MTDEKGYDPHREAAREREQVQELFRPRIEMASRLYEQAITGLWLGNAGAAIATLNFIGGKFRGEYHFPTLWLLSLSCFVFGLISMGIGAAWTLRNEKKVIDRIEGYETFLQMHPEDIRTPTEIVGLSTKDIRTTTALFAGVLFVAGCIFGLCLLAYHPTALLPIGTPPANL